MTNQKEFQRAYNKLYKQMRKYVWSFDIVCVLADIEFGCYTLFVRDDSLKKNIDKLGQLIATTLKEDKDLTAAYNKLRNLIYDKQDVFVRLQRMKEVSV